MDLLQRIFILKLFLWRSLFWKAVGPSLSATGRLGVIFNHLGRKIEASKVFIVLREISMEHLVLFFYLSEELLRNLRIWQRRDLKLIWRRFSGSKTLISDRR